MDNRLNFVQITAKEQLRKKAGKITTSTAHRVKADCSRLPLVWVFSDPTSAIITRTRSRPNNHQKLAKELLSQHLLSFGPPLWSPFLVLAPCNLLLHSSSPFTLLPTSLFSFYNISSIIPCIFWEFSNLHSLPWILCDPSHNCLFHVVRPEESSECTVSNSLSNFFCAMLYVLKLICC